MPPGYIFFWKNLDTRINLYGWLEKVYYFHLHFTDDHYSKKNHIGLYEQTTEMRKQKHKKQELKKKEKSLV